MEKQTNCENCKKWEAKSKKAKASALEYWFNETKPNKEKLALWSEGEFTVMFTPKPMMELDEKMMKSRKEFWEGKKDNNTL